jgi:hypothetical protein
VTPEEAFAEMAEAVVTTSIPGRADHELAHVAADSVLVDIARAAGYGEAADLWEKSAEKWWWA